MLLVVLGVSAASLLASIWLTTNRPTWAFYLLPARMIELLAGAAVAVAGPAFIAVNATYRAALGWFGMVGIGVAVVCFDSSTAFPGVSMLLPVLSTVLVIVAGGLGGAPNGPELVLRHPVAQWIGAHSYSIYLWHWPALVLCEARFGPLGLWRRLLIVAGSVGLAALTKRYVEDPVRHHRWLAAVPGRGLALGGALVVTSLAVGGLARANEPRLDSGEVAAAPTLVVEEVAPPLAPGAATESTVVDASAAEEVTAGGLSGTTLGEVVAANQAVLEQGLAATDVPSNLRPSLATAEGDRTRLYADGCVNIGVDDQLEPCRYGVLDAPEQIVLYGDSHAAQWFPAFEELAIARGAELVVLTKGGCPTAAVSIPTNTLARTCPIWRDAAARFIAAEQPDLVVVTAWSDYPNSDEEWATGLDETLARLAPATRQLVVLGDNPPSETRPNACLSNHLRDADACVSDRADVVPARRHAVEAASAARNGATFVDPSDWFCTAQRCPVMIGDILLYRDATHITTIASSWFRPLLEASLAPLLP